LATDGYRIRVDAPPGVLDDRLRGLLVENKPALVKLLQWEGRRLCEADRHGFVVRWAEERGWIALHDPTTGEWHEVRAEECLPSLREAANAELRRRGARNDRA
jgi:hypothetical protein